jgi:hydroxymethylglutaryl-CoA synthase
VSGPPPSPGIVAWGAYLPYWRLERRAIAEALGTPPAKGTRSVAGYDEDTTTIGPEAGRVTLALPGTPSPSTLLFSTPAPAYFDKTNATTVHAALGLPAAVAAYDACGSPRSAVGALASALALGRQAPALAVLADLRTGLAGGTDERDGGDGAAAFVCGADGVVAELVAHRSASEEFLDRWRGPDEQASHQWEERFGEEVYVPLAVETFGGALEEAKIEAGDLDHVIVTGLHARAVRSAAGRLGVRDEARAPDLTASVGNLGAAHAGVSLADVLDRAAPGQRVAVVVLADGADVLVLETTDALADGQRRRTEAGVPTVADQIASARGELPYTRFLSWRGQLRREPPRRPDPERPGAPTMWRSEGWKYAFDASRCTECGFRHLPPTRVCLRCHAVDRMEPERLADIEGTIATYTVDRLAYSLSPPVVGVVVDFDGGGRYRCEMTDVDPEQLAIGTRVRMTFRRVYTADGVHNYFWKAQPLRRAGGA